MARDAPGHSGGPITPSRPRPASLWINLIVTLVVPIAILSQLSGEQRLGPMNALLLALCFPIAYGVWALASQRRWDGLAMLGIANVLLTGSLALLGADAWHIAIKEAAIPAALAVAVIISGLRNTPLVRTLLWQRGLFQVDAIDAALRARGNADAFERSMRRANHWVAGSFALSSALNYTLASIVLSSPPGSVAFNQEFARMTALSYPVIALPCSALLIAIMLMLTRNLLRLTGMPLESVLGAGAASTQPHNPSESK